MNITELYRLTEWIRANIQGRNIPNKYQELYNLVHRNSQPNQAKVPFEDQRADLEKTISELPLFELSNEQRELLARLEISQYVGETGVTTLNDLFTRQALDIVTVANRLQQTIEKINSGIARANNIGNGLKDIVDTTKVPQSMPILRVTFTRDASIQDVTELESWSKVWSSIGRGVAMTLGMAPQDLKVVGASEGSIVLELTSHVEIIAIFNFIVMAALHHAKDFLQIRKLSAETKKAKIEAKTAELFQEKLRAELDNARKNSADQIATEVLKQFPSDKARTGEVNTALSLSIRELIKFMEKGGQVDCVVPKEPSAGDVKAAAQITAEDIKRLTADVENIRKLEAELKLLGNDDKDE